LANDVGRPATTAQPPSTVIPGHLRLADALRSWWWLALLLVAVSLIVGGSVQHAFDQRRADRSLYDVQVLTTASRFIGEEAQQVALPVAKRNVVAFEDLADSINSDIGVNGEGTLHVSLGSGSAATFTQIAFEINVASPYASTTFVVWFVRGAGPGGMGQQNVGSCLLSTSLQGAGRATAHLDLGASGLNPCTPDLWPAHQPDPLAPRLALAHIPQSGNF
jgi:hypothetical protein